MDVHSTTKRRTNVTKANHGRQQGCIERTITGRIAETQIHCWWNWYQACCKEVSHKNKIKRKHLAVWNLFHQQLGGVHYNPTKSDRHLRDTRTKKMIFLLFYASPFFVIIPMYTFFNLYIMIQRYLFSKWIFNMLCHFPFEFLPLCVSWLLEMTFGAQSSITFFLFFLQL